MLLAVTAYGPCKEPDMIEQDKRDQRSARKLVLMVCIAQTLVQIGAFFWPASCLNSHPMVADEQRGRLGHHGVLRQLYACCAVLVTLTDQVDPKRIYLIGMGLTIVGHLLLGLVGDDFLVSPDLPDASRYRLGRHLHDRPEASR
jgi:hypothetical protein